MTRTIHRGDYTLVHASGSLAELTFRWNDDEVILVDLVPVPELGELDEADHLAALEVALDEALDQGVDR